METNASGETKSGGLFYELQLLTGQGYARVRACKCGAAMRKVSCFTAACIVFQCVECGRRGHYGGKPTNCEAGYD